MSLIYHDFPTAVAAGGFAAAVVDREPDRTATLCASQEVSDVLDPFPFALDGFIVLVSRDDFDTGELEDAIKRIAAGFGGRFAGT